jgi:MerR family transcriptional regulator, thiopeptide resistance regulator
MVTARAQRSGRITRHVSGGRGAVQPDKVYGNTGLNQAEAEQDGTALIGHFAPERTDHFGRPHGWNRATAEAIGRDWNRISERVAALFTSGVPDNDPRTQQVIHEHYQWIRNFWTPDRDSYIRLAQMYVSQPKFRRRIERKKPKGMAAYMRDAMTAYAYSRLR